MATTDLDDFIPPAPPMQAPGLPSFEASPWDTYEPSSTSQGECPPITRKLGVNSETLLCNIVCRGMIKEIKVNESYSMRVGNWLTL